MEGEGLVHFYHVNNVSVYLGRQRERGVPYRKNAFCTHVLRFETGAVRFLLRKSLKLQRFGQNLQD